ncbi:MAG: glucose-6-phosphate 1-dehydrogenase [Parcubacteria group bacterium Gr01-1014_31]|nr:MAG: glucose-6-phosphate 1-dehydrogenase [Parcubacteria group bacterium Gr01-1014_31]
MEHPGASQIFSKTPTILVVFGATGDLMQRKLVPSLFRLHTKNLLPPLFHVVGYSRRDLTSAQFQEHVAQILAGKGEASAVQQFAKRFTYQQGFLDEPAGYTRLGKVLGLQDQSWKTCANKLFYLAVPPAFYKTVLTNLATSKLTAPCSPEEGWTRVMVEKPFGKDLATAEELDALLGKLFKEAQVYRLDHYLGKDTVRNILAFRFSNAFFEPSWNRDHVERITIRLWETAGIQGRGEFYDGIGALRDVGQNHLLQLLALFLMDNPGTFDANAIRRQRQRVLEALATMTPEEVESNTLRGQYEGYRQEEGVVADSATETYFRVKTHLQMPRWEGVPIYLASGKKMAEDKAVISVTFKHPMPCLCPPSAGRHYRNVLRYQLQPREGIAASFWVKKPGPGMVLEEKDFAFDYHAAFGKEEFIEAYEKLLLDAFAGDQTLFVSTGEIMASWRFTDPITRTWMAGNPALINYRPGGASLRERLLPVDEQPAKRELGIIGLGKMGQGIALRLQEKGWQVTAYNRTVEKLAAVTTAGVRGVTTIPELVARLHAPRVVWLMVSAGEAVDELLFGEGGLAGQLTRGDIVIDGGNSFFEDTARRGKLLSRRGIRFLDVGTSGGPHGARHGACLMVGGPRETYRELLPLWRDLAVSGGYGYFGAVGAGHFVKMVHNGIEYGMMQAIAEGFATMKKSRFKLDLEAVADVYSHGSVVESRLVSWLHSAYRAYGQDLAHVSGSVGHTGEGEWTVKTAKKLKVPAPIIKGSYDFRVKSKRSPSYTGKVLSALRNQFGGHDVGKSKGKAQKGKIRRRG